jgi:hypothetical protein
MKYMLKQFFGFCGEIIAIKPDKDEVKGTTTKKESYHLDLLKWFRAGVG